MVESSHRFQTPAEVDEMAILELAIGFFVLAIIASVFGARGIAGLTMNIAKWLAIIFVVLAVVSLLWPG